MGFEAKCACGGYDCHELPSCLEVNAAIFRTDSIARRGCSGSSRVTGNKWSWPFFSWLRSKQWLFIFIFILFILLVLRIILFYFASNMS